MLALRDVPMPQLGESVHEATVVRWLVAVGEQVAEYQPIVEVDTDKVNAEIPAPFAGTVKELLVAEGSTVSVGKPIARFEASDVPRPVAIDAARRPPEPVPPGNRPRLQRPTPEGIFLSPAVREMLQRVQISPSEIIGTGRDGRITKLDVLAHLRRSAGQGESTTEPGADDLQGRSEPQLGPGDTFVPHTHLRKVVADRTTRSKAAIPHAWQMQEVDMTAVLASRRALHADRARIPQREVGLAAYVVKAVSNALRSVPSVNSTWTPNGLIVHRDVNVAVSIGLDDAVVLAVIRQADQKSLTAVSDEIVDMTARARSGGLRLEDTARASITVNNSGVYGTSLSYAVIPLGQVGIVTMGAIRTRPWMIGDRLAFRPIMHLSFSLDHRVMDGLIAARFLTACREWLERARELDQPL